MPQGFEELIERARKAYHSLSLQYDLHINSHLQNEMLFLLDELHHITLYSEVDYNENIQHISSIHDVINAAYTMSEHYIAVNNEVANNNEESNAGRLIIANIQ